MKPTLNPNPPRRHHPPAPHRRGLPIHVLYNLEQAASAADLAAVLVSLGEQVAATSSVTFREDLVAELAPQLELKVRYEQTPHGTWALRIAAEWDADIAAPELSGSLEELLR